MASEHVLHRLPPLPVWASSRLVSLLRSKTADRFNKLFDATFAPNLEVVFDGKNLTRDQYKELLLAMSEAGPWGTTEVQIEGETAVNPAPSEDRLGGFVGMLYTTRGTSDRIVVLGRPTRYHVASSINLTVKGTLFPPSPIPFFDPYFDARRVTAVNQILQPSSLTVSFPGSVVHVDGTSVSGKIELGPGPVKITQAEEELSVLGNKFSTATVPEAEVDVE